MSVDSDVIEHQAYRHTILKSLEENSLVHRKIYKYPDSRDKRIGV